MTVGELEELLAMLPEDMAVVIATGGTCVHITSVEKHDTRTPRSHPNFWRDAAMVDGRLPPKLLLRGGRGSPAWFEAFGSDVEFEVTGRWPAKPRRDKTRG